MSLPIFDLNDMMKDVPRSLTSMESAAGPVAAAMMVPMTVAMTGWVAMFGMGMGIVQALLPSAMTDCAPDEGRSNVVQLKAVEPKVAKVVAVASTLLKRLRPSRRSPRFRPRRPP